MKSKEFDKKFDENKADIIDDLDLSTLVRPNQEQKRVNVDFPVWIINSLDKEASRVGVTRQSIIKLWLAERLEEQALTRRSSGLAKASRFLHTQKRAPLCAAAELCVSCKSNPR